MTSYHILGGTTFWAKSLKKRFTPGLNITKILTIRIKIKVQKFQKTKIYNVAKMKQFQDFFSAIHVRRKWENEQYLQI